MSGGSAQRNRDAEVERLRQMNELKTRFLNMAAHELNTPMTPIRLQVHLLKSAILGPLSSRQRGAVETIDRNVERLESLVKEVLDVARLEAGELRVRLEPVALEDAGAEVMGTFGEVARQVGIGLTWQVPPGLRVMADRGRLVQVLYNLVSNALKFTHDGEVRIEARQEGMMVRIDVSDTGAGLEAGQIERLFKPFSQVHDQDKVTVPGTGLGLYICLGIVRQMGGDMSVASGGAGRGSTFAFTLPVAVAESSSLQAPPGAAMPAPAPPTPVNPIVARLRELI